MTQAIGLGFGTTNSALAIAQSDRKVRLAEFHGKTTFRSVFFDGENHGADSPRIVTGPRAIQDYLQATEPDRLI